MNRFNTGFLFIIGLGLLAVMVFPAAAQETPPAPEAENTAPEEATPEEPAANPVTDETLSLINQLLNDDPEVVDGARTELLEIGSAAVPRLLEALANDKPALRYMVCEILAELRDARAYGPLLGLLKDKSEYTASIASAAVRALGRLGDPSVISPLIKTSSSADVDLRYESIKALGILRASEAITLTINALTDTAETFLGYQVRCAAVQALGRLKATASLPKLINLLEVKAIESATELTIAQYAISALEKVTDHSEGSFLWRDEKQRDEVIWRWNDWWGKNKAAYGFEEPPPEEAAPPEKPPEDESVKPPEKATEESAPAEE